MKIKRVTISSQAWGDPYPCGDLTSVRIGGKEIGTCVGADEKLIKGGTIKVKSNGSAVEKKFKVAPVQDNVLLASKRFGIEKGTITPVEISR